jgi:deoxyribodipyrimidine photo-lyase
MYSRSLFVFRQDLRIEDNTALYQAIKKSKEIIPVFIFDDIVLEQSPSQDSRLGFLIDAVQELNQNLLKLNSYLYITKGKPEEIIPKLITQYCCDAYFTNISYGPRSTSRDQSIHERCSKHNIAYLSYTDFLLLKPEAIQTMKVFTPFYKRRLAQAQENFPALMQWNYQAYIIDKISSPKIDIPNHQKVFEQIDSAPNTHRPVKQEKYVLDNSKLNNYLDTRNYLDQNGTSKLSPYIRFWLISIRNLIQQAIRQQRNKEQILWDISRELLVKNTYLSELARREFRHHIMYNFPETKQIEFLEKRRHIQRSQDSQLLEARTESKTGYPIVDAAMRQLREENRMHGRARMIVASFLTKDLLIDRRLGEQHFAKYLLDYDPAVNIGNRQRSASVGADPKPLRIFNPILQSQRFDPQAKYIKKYLPELEHEPIEAIHDPLTYKLNRHKPVVNHYDMSKKTKKEYARYQ